MRSMKSRPLPSGPSSGSATVSHVASSAAPFGLLSFGYDAESAHAHPAGLGLAALN